MTKKQLCLGLAFALGLFLAAGYTIDNEGFHSGVYGLAGCLLLVGSYAGFYWDRLRTGDHHVRRLLLLLGGLVLVIIILDIIEAILA